MNRLDPEQLQENFDKQAKHGGLLSAVGKPKYWDQYKDYFAGLQGDREDAFRRLFGEEFALAYEKQVDRLLAAAGDQELLAADVQSFSAQHFDQHALQRRREAQAIGDQLRHQLCLDAQAASLDGVAVLASDRKDLALLEIDLQAAQ